MEVTEDIARYMFDCKVSREKATESVREWWDERSIAKDLSTRGYIEDARLVYAPFWRIQANLDGTIFGFEYEDRESYSVKVKANRKVDLNYFWTGIACKANDIGVKYLRHLDGEMKPFENCPGPTLAVTEDSKAAIERGGKAMTEEAEVLTGLPEISGNNIGILYYETSLVYYPLWIIKYTRFGKVYSATVDGVTGDVLAGDAPGDLTIRIFFMAICIGLTAGGIALGAWLLGVSAIWGIWLIAEAIVFGVYLIPLAFDYLRHGPRIVYGDSSGGYRPFYLTRRGRCKVARAFGWMGMLVLLMGLVHMFALKAMWEGMILMLFGIFVQLAPRAMIAYQYNDCHDNREIVGDVMDDLY